MKRTFMVSLGSMLMMMPALANWPNYLGPEFDGKGDDTKLVEAVDDSTKAIWSVEIGPGFGGPAIDGNEVFLLDRIPGEKDLLRVLDLKTGREVYRTEYDAPGRLPFSGSRSVPTVRGEFVFTSGGFGQATCFSRKTRAIVWSHDLVKEFGGEIPRFGYSTQPVVFDDVVIYAPLGKDVGLIAFTVSDGSVAWKTDGLYSSTSSPIIHRINGIDQCLFTSSSTAGNQSRDGVRYLSSFDPASGKLLWRYDGFDSGNPIPAVTALNDTTLLLTGGYEAGTQILKVLRRGVDFTIERQATLEKGSQIHTPIQYENHVYLTVNENSNLQPRSKLQEGGLMCITREGEVKWRTGDKPNFGRGGMVLADGKLIIQDGNSGVVHLVKPNPEKYQELGSANVFETGASKDHQMWAPPAISQGFLLVRSQELLLCLDLRAAPQEAESDLP